MNRIFTCSLLAVLAFTLSACSGRTGPVEGYQEVALSCTEEPLEGFDPALYADLQTPNPPARLLYNRLVELQPKLKAVEGKGLFGGLKILGQDSGPLVPGLARRWKHSDDGTEVSFHLRRGVKFHTTDYFTPTREFNADDVIFSFARLTDSAHPWYEYDSSLSWKNSIADRLGALFTDIRRDGDYTVAFVLRTPFEDIEKIVSFLEDEDAVSILSAEYAAQLEASNSKPNLNTRPVGTGVLQFLRHKPGGSIHYALHPSYWDRDRRRGNFSFQNPFASLKDCQASYRPPRPPLPPRSRIRTR